MNEKSGPRDLLIVSYLSFIVLGMPQALLGVAWIHMQVTFSVSLDALGILLTTSTVGRMVATFYSAALARWIGGNGRFLLVGSLLSLVGAFGYALAPSWPTLLLTSFILGIGGVGINTGINAFASSHYPASRVNWLHAWFGMGSTIAPTIVTFIVIDLNQTWQWSYLVLAAFQLVVTLLIALNLGRWEVENAAQRAAAPAERLTMGATFRLWPVWFIMGMAFFHAGIQISAGQLSPSLFIEGRFLDPKVVGTWITVYWGSLTAGRFLTGIIVDRLGVARLLRIDTFLAVAGAILLWWHVSDLLSFIGLALIGFGVAPIAPTLVAETPRRVGKRHLANTIAFQFSAAAVGAAALPGLGAALGERIGLETIPPFLILITLGLFLLHEWFALREKRAVLTQPSTIQ